MPNFEKRQSATRKTPDPSNKPWTGELTGTWTLDDDDFLLELNSPFSLDGVPNVNAIDEDGNTLAVATSAFAEGSVLRLNFEDVTDGVVALSFAPRDPHVRGPQGQYVTPADMGEDTHVTAQLLSGEMNTATGQLTLVFSSPVEFIGGNDDIKAYGSDDLEWHNVGSPVQNDNATFICDVEQTGPSGLNSTVDFADGAFIDLENSENVAAAVDFFITVTH